MPILSRRKLLAGMIASGASSMLSSTAAFANSRRVLIVGAGLAGLYSARLLEQLGFEVQVVEARSRVGGRVYTLDEVPGHPEAGGNGVGSNYGRVLDTAQKLGVEMRRQLRGLPSDLYIDNTHLSGKQWQNWPDNPLPKELKALTPSRLSGHFMKDIPIQQSADWRNANLSQFDVSAADFFRSKGLNDDAIALLDINNSYGNTLDSTSLLSLYRVRANINRLIAIGKPGLEASDGNMRIPEAMANSLAKPIELGQRITNIRQSSSGIVADSASGASYQADAVIIALPIPAVKNIRFEPLLASDQQAAYESIEYHKLTQAHMIAEEPFWEATGHKGSLWSNGPLGRVFTRQIPNTSLYNMTVWINGDECDAFDGLTKDLAKEKIMQEFVRAYPGSNSANVELRKLVQWHNEPLNQGAWALWRPGQINRFFKVLHQAAGQIFFAGEHTAYSYSGMEGAAESGERAALEVARSLA